MVCRNATSEFYAFTGGIKQPGCPRVVMCGICASVCVYVRLSP